MITSVGRLAKELGVSGQTVRTWTSYLHLKPSRSSGGWRHYSEEQVSKLMLFKFLVKTERYTLEGARKVLWTSATP